MAENLVKNNEAAGRFELAADGQTGVLTYRLKPRSIVLVHTEVPEKLQGQGIAGKLAAAGLEFARQKGLTVIPLCPFVVGYLKRHQEYLDLVQKAYRGRVRG
jgi:predicted GNAT family acetyltransferase